MYKLEGKVAFITGAARGQGRSHAVRLAQEGADIIGVDICAPIASVPYPMATQEDMKHTARAVEAAGRRFVALQTDVRDERAVKAALDEGTNELGPVDIALANAGITAMAPRNEPEVWQDIIDVNLTGVFNTIEAVVPSMVERGAGGSIVLTSSTAGLVGVGGPTRAGLAYAASKHGVVGLMRSYANNLAPHGIRVNSIHPTGVRTPMIDNPAAQDYLAKFGSSLSNALPVDALEPSDISDAILWLVSDAARYVTGVTLPVDAGFTNLK